MRFLFLFLNGGTYLSMSKISGEGAVKRESWKIQKRGDHCEHEITEEAELDGTGLRAQ